MLERMWSKGNASPSLVGVQTATLEISMAVSHKIEIDLPQDPEIPLLDIYPNDSHSYHKDICSAMFILALFVIARTWKQLRYSQPKNR